MPQTFVLPKQVVLADGSVAAGAIASFFRTQTNNPQSVYTDAALTSATVTITADAAGILPKVYLNPSAQFDYRVRIETSTGTLIYQEDDISRLPFAQSDIALTLFPATDSEDSAGVTPTDYAYLTERAVNIQRYGASPTATAAANVVAIQSALNTGEHVFIPAGTYQVNALLNLTAAGQCVFGEGLRSKVVQTGTNANGTVFRAFNLGRNEFHGIYAVPSTSVVSLTDGYGFAIVNSDHCVVRNCRVTDHRRGGVMLYNSDYCKVLDNFIIDSVVASGVGVTQSDTGSDIYLGGACSYNLIRGNHCINGAGFGIAVQTLNSGDVSDHNIIAENIINDQDLYGILLYLFGGSTSIHHTLIANNKINTVTGNIPESGGLFNYGAGIAVQSADHTSVIGNTIRNTNTHSPQDIGQVPAAIGISGVDNCLVSDNVIEDASYYGIACIQSNATSGAGRGLIISNNNIRNVAQRGIYILDVPNATVTGNRLRASAANAPGILIRQDAFTQSDDFIVADNRVSEFQEGIKFEGTINRAHVHDNIVRGNTGDGITLSAAFTNCHDNTVINGTGGNGIVCGNAPTNGYIVRNFISGGDFGIVDDGTATLRVDDNIITGATTAHSTLFYRTLANSATPSVRNKKYWLKNDTTAITNLTDGYVGQVIVIKFNASATLTNNANILLAGAANFSGTSSDFIELIFDSSLAWFELSRSVN